MRWAGPAPTQQKPHELAPQPSFAAQQVCIAPIGLHALMHTGSNPIRDSSIAVDTDFTAKLVDVWPDGTQMLVQDGIVRMRWRAGAFATATSPPLVPGKPERAELIIGLVSHVFDEGHRIGLTVSSSNNPRFSVNPNTGLPLNSSLPSLPTVNTVLSGGERPTRLLLPVVPLEALPVA